MNIAIINRTDTTAASSNQPVSYYTCQRCGNTNIILNNNYCPNCGEHIDKFYIIREKI